MADTTTILDLGTGGDTMDESLVLQSDDVTQAKRPRVVIGGDAGYDGTDNDLVQPVAADPGASPFSLPTLLIGLVNDTPGAFSPGEFRPVLLTTEGRVRTSSSEPRVGVAWYAEEQRSMWGTCPMDPNTPWSDW